jgi:hypothetical protein
MASRPENKWSQRVAETSNALDLEAGVFTKFAKREEKKVPSGHRVLFRRQHHRRADDILSACL